MKVYFLGTGTSTGIPEIGCNCEVCRSEDPKDKRFRSSVLVEHAGKHLLIDCGPDFRMQMLNTMRQSRFHTLEGVLITHEHYDHVGGLDDLRSFCYSGAVELFAEQTVGTAICQRMPYAFSQERYPGVPNLRLQEIGLAPFSISGIEVTPIRLYHGQLPILGFRIGNMAYLTDLKTIPDEEYRKLEHLDLLIMNALRPQEHFAHQSSAEAILNARKIGAGQTWFIHASHAFGKHEEIQKQLPESIYMAYDGLVLEV